MLVNHIFHVALHHDFPKFVSRRLDCEAIQVHGVAIHVDDIILVRIAVLVLFDLLKGDLKDILAAEALSGETPFDLLIHIGVKLFDLPLCCHSLIY